MSSRYSEKIITKIRKEVLSGKTKYQIAKEMDAEKGVITEVTII